MRRPFAFWILLAAPAFMFFSLGAGAAEKKGSDRGTFFLQPASVKKEKPLGAGQIFAYNQPGVVLSATPGSPFHETSYLAQGSRVVDKAGKTVANVALVETIDPDGDLVWSIVSFEKGATTGAVALMAGTGKWKGITGKGTVTMPDKPRADGFERPRFDITWEVGPHKQWDLTKADGDAYPFHDRGLSFHGPHVHEQTRKLAGNITLVVNNQSGVLTSEDPKAKSPRNFATCFDRGTTYQINEQTQGDVMLLEDTDADGDVVWLYHEWWYDKGPGSYRFITGTGKWAGIKGIGITRGMFKGRKDDHYMLKSEMHWRLPK